MTPPRKTRRQAGSAPAAAAAPFAADAPDADAPIDDEPAAPRFLFLSIFRSSKAIAHDAK